MSSSSLVSPDVWQFDIPQLMVSAGSGGAMLTITLLQASQIVIEPGRVLVLHDPVGLTGERILAHVYREAAFRVAGAAEDVASAGAMSGGVHLQWLAVRSPIARVWEAMDSLDDRAWRAVQRKSMQGSKARTRTFPAAHAVESRSSRVAETLQASLQPSKRPSERPSERPSDHTTEIRPNRERSRALMLLSESDRPDAISALATARLLARALRRRWAVLACAREGPRSAAAGLPTVERAWCDRVVCQGGVLRPVAAR